VRERTNRRKDEGKWLYVIMRGRIQYRDMHEKQKGRREKKGIGWALRNRGEE